MLKESFYFFISSAYSPDNFSDTDHSAAAAADTAAAAVARILRDAHAALTELVLTGDGVRS